MKEDGMSGWDYLTTISVVRDHLYGEDIPIPFVKAFDHLKHTLEIVVGMGSIISRGAVSSADWDLTTEKRLGESEIVYHWADSTVVLKSTAEEEEGVSIRVYSEREGTALRLRCLLNGTLTSDNKYMLISDTDRDYVKRDIDFR